jgi:hypothetical protein
MVQARYSQAHADETSMNPPNHRAESQLTRAVQHRLEELGVPSSLIEVDKFREYFFVHRWVMFIRDGEEVPNVHLVQPGPNNHTSFDRPSGYL